VTGVGEMKPRERALPRPLQAADQNKTQIPKRRDVHDPIVGRVTAPDDFLARVL
jgi:hypothetical protein